MRCKPPGRRQLRHRPHTRTSACSPLSAGHDSVLRVREARAQTALPGWSGRYWQPRLRDRDAPPRNAVGADGVKLVAAPDAPHWGEVLVRIASGRFLTPGCMRPSLKSAHRGSSISTWPQALARQPDGPPAARHAVVGRRQAGMACGHLGNAPGKGARQELRRIPPRMRCDSGKRPAGAAASARTLGRTPRERNTRPVLRRLRCARGFSCSVRVCWSHGRRGAGTWDFPSAAWRGTLLAGCGRRIWRHRFERGGQAGRRGADGNAAA